MAKNILIISNAALCQSDSNGRTLSRLLDNINKDRKAQFFVYGVPDFKECSSFYQVSDKDAFLSFVKRQKKDGRILDNSFCISNISISKIGKKTKKTPLKMILRELVWKWGAWNNIYLKEWLRSITPNCILIFAADNIFTLNFAYLLAKERGLPVVLYSTEEYPFKKYNYITRRFSFFYFIWRVMLKRAYKKISKYVKVGIFNSNELMKLYFDEYGFKCCSIYQESNIQWVENFRLVKTVKVSYLGNLGLNRHKALIEIAGVLNRICPNVKLDIYGNPENSIKEELNNCPYICFKGFIPYEQVVRVIHDSTLIVHAEYMDQFYAEDLKYAFSTKITDSVCSGTPFFIYASSELIETRFLKEHHCAFVAIKQNELFDQLKLALTDEYARKKVLDNAKIVRDRYFTNKGKFAQILEEVISENTSNQ